VSSHRLRLIHVNVQPRQRWLKALELNHSASHPAASPTTEIPDADISVISPPGIAARRAGAIRLIQSMMRSKGKCHDQPGQKSAPRGGGIGSLAAAAFMIRDGGLPGGNITIYEALPLLAEASMAAAIPATLYLARRRMLTTDNYECTWGLFKSIPSLVDPDKTVFDETVEFNQMIKAHSQARLVDRNRAIVDVTSMGFSMSDRMELLKLMTASEPDLGTDPISDWLSPNSSRPGSGTCGRRPLRSSLAQRSSSNAICTGSSRNSRASKRSRREAHGVQSI